MGLGKALVEPPELGSPVVPLVLEPRGAPGAGGSHSPSGCGVSSLRVHGTVEGKTLAVGSEAERETQGPRESKARVLPPHPHQPLR